MPASQGPGYTPREAKSPAASPRTRGTGTRPKAAPKSLAGLGNQTIQRAAKEGALAAPPDGDQCNQTIQRVAKSGTGAPLTPSVRESYENWFDADLSGVRVHSNGEAQDAAHAIRARAFTAGEHIVLGEEGSKELLAHELTHVLQQRAGAAPMDESPISERGDAAEIEARQVAGAFSRGESAPPIHISGHGEIHRDEDDDDGEGERDPEPDKKKDEEGKERRGFTYTVSSSDPTLIFVSGSADRVEISRGLFGGDETRGDTFYFASNSEFGAALGGGGGDSRAIRFYDPQSAPGGVIETQRALLDAKLTADLDATVQGLVGSVDSVNQPAMAAMLAKWSQFSKFKDDGGTSYFERFMQGLDSRKMLITHADGTTETRSAYQQLLKSMSGPELEIMQKAITLRSERDVGYKVKDGSPALAPGAVIGRWFAAKDDTAIQIVVTQVVVSPDPAAQFSAQNPKEAEIQGRSSFYLGPRAVIPGKDGTYVYGLDYLTIAGGPLPGTEPGRFTWYYPGTVFIGPREFDPAGFQMDASTPAAAFMVSDRLNMAKLTDASVLLGLDYGALATASVDERIQIFQKTLDQFGTSNPGSTGFFTDADGLDLLTRTMMTVRPEDFPKFERMLDEKGLTGRLMQIKAKDMPLRRRLLGLGQAFTYQSMTSMELGQNAFSDLETLRMGQFDNSEVNYFQAQSSTEKSHVISRDEWDPNSKMTAEGETPIEMGLPGEETKDIGRTTVSFNTGAFPESYAVDTSRWTRRREGPRTRRYLPGELLTLETSVKGQPAQRIVSAFEAALLQGDPESESSGKDLQDFTDTIMLVQAAFGATQIVSMATKAAAAGSLRAGLTLFAEELMTTSGKTAVRGIADYGLFKAATYAQEHQEELEQTPEGRAFMAATTAAMGFLFAKDMAALAESGLGARVIAAGERAMAVVSGAARAGVARTVAEFKAIGAAWRSLKEAGAIEMVTNVAGIRVLRPRSLEEFGQAYRVAGAQAAGETLLGSLGGATKARAESVLGQLEKASGSLKAGTAGVSAEQIAASKAYRDVARHAADLPAAEVDAFLESVEKTLAVKGRTADQLAPFLQAAVKHPNPNEFLKAVQWVAGSGLSDESLAVLAKKLVESETPPDLLWLSTKKLNPDDLEFLAGDSKTGWNWYKRAEEAAAELAKGVADPERKRKLINYITRANKIARGAAAEMVAAEQLGTMLPGYRVEWRQVPMGPELEVPSEIDYQLISTSGTGARRGLEVKGFTPKSWKDYLDAEEIEEGAAGAGSKSGMTDAEKKVHNERVQTVNKMLGQLDDAKKIPGFAGRVEAPALAVSNKIAPKDLERLKALLKASGLGDVQVVLIDETAIGERSARIRQGMGLK